MPPVPLEQFPVGSLVDATFAGESAAFEVLFRRYHAALLRVAASHLRRRDWAEETVQETFLAAFRSLASYNSQYSFRTWLWTILLNQCRRTWKRQTGATPQTNTESTPNSTQAWIEPVSSEPSPMARMLAEEKSRHLERLLSELPEPQADALRLRFFGGLKFEEIAAAMDCSLNTAKNRVKSGLLRLSTELGAHAPQHRDE